VEAVVADAIPGQGAIAVKIHAAVEAARRTFERDEDARLAFNQLAQRYNAIRRSVRADDARQHFGVTTFDAEGRRG